MRNITDPSVRLEAVEWVYVGKLTMATEGFKSVPIICLTDVTLAFVISLSGKFLPMQVIKLERLKPVSREASVSERI